MTVRADVCGSLPGLWFWDWWLIYVLGLLLVGRGDDWLVCRWFVMLLFKGVCSSCDVGISC